MGFFLSDAVKCRCDKGSGEFPIPIARNCGQRWLETELEIVNPKRTCTLGNTTLLALSTVPGYEKLSSKRVTIDLGVTVNARRSVLIWTFSSGLTSAISGGHERTFRDFSFL